MKLIIIEETPSTNGYLAQNPQLLETNFLALRAVCQTAGRGRHNRSWESTAGNDLTFSIVCHLDKNTNPASVTILAGLAVYRVLRAILSSHDGDASPHAAEREGVTQTSVAPSRAQRSPNIHIKWPNDIYVADKKICGILTELVQMPSYNAAIIGIGVNVNSGVRDLPETAVSLAMVTGNAFDVNALAISVGESVESLLSGRPFPLDDRIIAEWTSASKSLGKTVAITDQNWSGRALIAGINRDGSLRLVRGDGSEFNFFGEVSFDE